MRVRSYSDAEAHIRHLLALPGVSQTSQFTIFGQYQLGRILDLQGRREEALACYRKVLELPDQHDAHRLASEAIQKPPRPEDLD
jgi:tetratricopeptide (TPR) repeat protein